MKFIVRRCQLAAAWDKDEIWLERAGSRLWTLPWQSLLGVRALQIGQYPYDEAICLIDKAGVEKYWMPVYWSKNPDLRFESVVEAINAHLPPEAPVPGRFAYVRKPNAAYLAIAMTLGLALTGWSCWLVWRAINFDEASLIAFFLPLIGLGIVLCAFAEVGVIIALRRAGKDWVPPICIKHPPS